MYENNYPNSYNHDAPSSDSVNGYSQGSGDAYQYGSSGTYYSTGGSQYQNHTGGQGKKNKGGTGKKVAIAVCCGLFFGVFAGVGFQAVDSASDYLKTKTEKEQISQQALPENSPEGALGDAGGEQAQALAGIPEVETGNGTVHATVTDVTEVVKAVMPSVVSVNNRYVERMTFFGQEYSQEVGGSGSGIIVGKNDTELLIVTNYHVVESAEELTVQFTDGSQVQAQAKGQDMEKDLAVIAVQLSDIDASTMGRIAIAKLGNSDELTVGEPVVAIGNALGYGQSVTAGVVSALDRAIAATDVSQGNQNGDMEINTFIQTDAAINPGNSGGALINIRGEVIGINSNKIGGSTVEGMGYAIPISDAKPIIEDLKTKQTKIRIAEEDRGILGITGVDVTADTIQLYGFPKGVFVSSVTEGTGAHKAGIIRGDIITGINGEEVVSMAELKGELSYYAAGTVVELTIMQGSAAGFQEKTVEVTLGRSESVQ